MMRKAFSFFAAVALAFAAQAETTTWMNGFYAQEGETFMRPAPHESETLAGQRVYVVYGSLTLDELWEYKFASMDDTQAGELAKYYADFKIESDGTGPVIDMWGSGASGSHDFETTPVYHLLMFDTTYPENARKYYFSASITPEDLSAEIDVTAYLTAAGVADNWRALPVPEPTSGLLFLFGLAGLALKRRRG